MAERAAAPHAGGLVPDGSHHDGAVHEGQQDGAVRLAPYVSRLAMQWLAEDPEERVRTVEGTLAFVDVSGFTALTERLASRGKAGAEEVSDVVGATFAKLLEIAYEYGGEMVKWGGDAALLLFEEPQSAVRASRATWLISRAMPRLGNVSTSVGRVRLGVSIGVHRGRFDLYLLGEGHRELVVTGPPATETTRMEGAAESGQVLVSAATAAELPPQVLGAEQEGGRLLQAAPQAEPRQPPRANLAATDPSGLLSSAVRHHLLGGGERAEHRYASISFIQFRGVDALYGAAGGRAVAEALEPIVSRAQEAADRFGVTFHYIDIAGDGGKILLTGGLPVVRGDDEERLLRATLDVVHAPAGSLRVRAGLNAGRFFVHDAGTLDRRIYSFSGDAINLAARVMGRADDAQVVATDSFMARVGGAFAIESLPPFKVKGKTEPVVASVVLGPSGGPGVSRAHTHPVDALVPLLGRAAELEALAEAAARAADGAGSAVEIVSDPGIGKSRLVAEASAHWELETRRMYCEEYGEASPYLPFRHLLHALLEVEEAAGVGEIVEALRSAVVARAPELEVWLPLLVTLVGAELPLTPEIEQIEPRFRRGRLADATMELLEVLADRPLGLVFEDVHAIDEASSDLLRQLVGAATTRPWLVVLTRRPTGASPLGDEVAPPHRRLELGPLDPSTAASLLDAGGDDLHLSVHDRRALVERSGGNPLFLLELASAVASDQRLDALPDDLELLLAAQIDRLEPADRQTLRAAAVLGVWFDVELLGRILGEEVGSSDLWGRLRSLVVPEGTGQGRFAHALVRDAAYEGLPFRRRRELHHRAAVAIEERAPDPEAEAPLLSLHYLHAGCFAETWRYARTAGRRAGAVYANVDAATFYRRAMEAAHHLRTLARAEVAEVAEALGDAEELAGEFNASASAYAVARRLAPAGAGRMRLLRKTGVVHERTGKYPSALRFYSLARRMAASGDPTAAVESCEAAVAYAATRFRQGRHHDCLRWAELATQEASSCGHQPGLAHALFLVDIARSSLGLPSDGAAQRALAVYEELDDPVGQGNVLNNMGVDAYYRGQWTEALAVFTRSARARERAGDVVGAATVQNNIAEMISDRGLLDEATELFLAARRDFLGAGYPVGVAQINLNLGRVAARRGDRSQAVEILEDALSAFRTLGSKIYELEAETRLLEADLLAGDVDGAADTARSLLSRSKALGGGDVLDATLLRLLGMAEAAVNPSAALANLDGAVAEARRLSADFELALCLAARAVVRGAREEVAATAGRAGAVADAVEARRLFGTLGVVSTPVTALDDLWPTGPLATELAGS